MNWLVCKKLIPELLLLCQKSRFASTRKPSEGFAATVSIDGQTQYPVSVRDPFDEKQEKDLEFYFEEWIQFPFDGQIKAQRAAASVQGYGERLFGEVFADPDAYSDYKLACREGLANLQIEVEGESPEFQALHWEALTRPQAAKAVCRGCGVYPQALSARGDAD